MGSLVVNALPLIGIVLVGLFLGKKKILDDSGIGALKALVMNIGLPGVFFAAFVSAELDLRYLVLFASVFVFCFVLYGAGALLFRWGVFKRPLAPFAMTGFEFGMVGIALFASFFGPENLPVVALIGLGHEFFIWFVYAPLLGYKVRGERPRVLSVAAGFFKSPIILAILSALVLNITGLHERWSTGGELAFLYESVLATARLCGNVLVPLILLVIGYNLRIDRTAARGAFRYILIRLALIGIIGTGLYYFVLRPLIALPPLFGWAWFTFLLLPPPYILPVFIPQDEESLGFFNGVIVIYTLISFVVFLGALVVAGL